MHPSIHPSIFSPPGVTTSHPFNMLPPSLIRLTRSLLLLLCRTAILFLSERNNSSAPPTNHAAPRALVFALFRYLCLTEAKRSPLSLEAALISVTYGRLLPSGCHGDMKARLENLNISGWRGSGAQTRAHRHSGLLLRGNQHPCVRFRWVQLPPPPPALMGNKLRGRRDGRGWGEGKTLGHKSLP